MCSTDGSGTLWTSGTDVICEFTCRSQKAHRNREKKSNETPEKIRELVNFILCIGYVSVRSRIYTSSYRRNISVTFCCVNKQNFRRCTTDAATGVPVVFGLWIHGTV